MPTSSLPSPLALIRPLVIFLGGEAPFATVPEEVQAHLGMASGDARDAFAALRARTDVYLFRKPYQAAGSKIDRKITGKWHRMAGLGSERVFTLDDPTRVVDALLGILATASRCAVVA